jgi:hypothetical protein
MTHLHRGQIGRAAPGQLAFDDRLVEIEEAHGLELASLGAVDHAVQGCLGDRAAAEPSDDGDDLDRAPGECLSHVGGDRSDGAQRQRPLEHDHSPCTGQRHPHRQVREGSEAGDAEAADAAVLGTALVDDVGHRALHRPQGDDDGGGVGAPVGADEAGAGPAEGSLEVGRNLAEQGESLAVAQVGQVAHLREGLRPDHRADRHRMGRVEHLLRPQRRQEAVDLLLLRDVYLLEGVGQHEAVHADHHGQREGLGQPERLHVQVRRLLVVGGVELQPAAVPLGHRVAVVVPDVDRGADRAVGHRHDDRQLHAGRR